MKTWELGPSGPPNIPKNHSSKMELEIWQCYWFSKELMDLVNFNWNLDETLLKQIKLNSPIFWHSTSSPDKTSIPIFSRIISQASGSGSMATQSQFNSFRTAGNTPKPLPTSRHDFSLFFCMFYENVLPAFGRKHIFEERVLQISCARKYFHTQTALKTATFRDASSPCAVQKAYILPTERKMAHFGSSV